MGKNTDDHGDNDEEVLLTGSDEDLDDDMNDEGGELPTPSANHKLVIVKPLRPEATNSPINGPITVRGKTGGENGDYNHAPEEGGRKDREALEILRAMSSHEGEVATRVNEILGGDLEHEDFSIRSLENLLDIGLSQEIVSSYFWASMETIIGQIERIEEATPNTFDPKKVALLKKRLADSRDIGGDPESEDFSIRSLEGLLNIGLSQKIVSSHFWASMESIIGQIERIEEATPNTFDPKKVALLKKRLADSRDVHRTAAQVNEALGGEISSGSARLEMDLAELPPLKMSHGSSSIPGTVPIWKRRTVQAIAALGLIGVVGGSAYKIWEQLQASPDETEEVAKPILPVAVPVNKSAAEESPQAATLYDEVGNKLEAKTEGSDLSQGTKARIHAASTNDLTESLYDGAKRWETLDGKWLDTPGAHANVVKKLTTWGGYQDVLTVSANANSIDEMLEDIANSDLPHAEHVAWKVAVQIASIKDSRVVPSVEEVETRLNTVDSATIDQTLDENIQNPPPVPGPSFFADQAEQTGSLDSGLYDAPEPVSLLAKAASVEIQTPITVAAPTPRFEDRFDVIEPAHVKPAVQTKAENPVVPIFMDPTEAAEPVALLAKREAEIPDVTEFMELEEEAKPAPKPVPTLMENAKSALSSLTSRFKSWLS